MRGRVSRGREGKFGRLNREKELEDGAESATSIGEVDKDKDMSESDGSDEKTTDWTGEIAA